MARRSVGMRRLPALLRHAPARMPLQPALALSIEAE